MQKHILIVLNDDVFQGASISDEKGQPRPIDDLSELEKLIPDLNLALVAGIEEVEAEKVAIVAKAAEEVAAAVTERDKCLQRADELYAVVLKVDEVLKTSADIADARNILEPYIVDAKTPEEQKQIAILIQQISELNMKIAEKEAELDKLTQ
jgi:hypothetical protein